jgi:hypothetical protein
VANPLGRPNLVTGMVSPDESLRKLNPGGGIVWLGENPRRRPTPATGMVSSDESLLTKLSSRRRIVWLDEDPRRRPTPVTGITSPDECLLRRPTPMTGMTSPNESLLRKLNLVKRIVSPDVIVGHYSISKFQIRARNRGKRIAGSSAEIQWKYNFCLCGKVLPS